MCLNRGQSATFYFGAFVLHCHTVHNTVNRGLKDLVEFLGIVISWCMLSDEHSLCECEKCWSQVTFICSIGLLKCRTNASKLYSDMARQPANVLMFASKVITSTRDGGRRGLTAKIGNEILTAASVFERTASGWCKYLIGDYILRKINVDCIRVLKCPSQTTFILRGQQWKSTVGREISLTTGFQSYLMRMKLKWLVANEECGGLQLFLFHRWT